MLTLMQVLMQVLMHLQGGGQLLLLLAVTDDEGYRSFVHLRVAVPIRDGSDAWWEMWPVSCLAWFVVYALD